MHFHLRGAGLSTDLFAVFTPTASLLAKHAMYLYWLHDPEDLAEPPIPKVTDTNGIPGWTWKQGCVQCQSFVSSPLLPLFPKPPVSAKPRLVHTNDFTRYIIWLLHQINSTSSTCHHWLPCTRHFLQDLLPSHHLLLLWSCYHTLVFGSLHFCQAEKRHEAHERRVQK